MRVNHMTKVNIGFLCLFLCAIMVFASGCGKGENTKVVLTTGLSKDEVFRIETESCSKPEMMVYITNMQNQYESVYGDEIWDTEVEGQSLENNVKDNALAKMAQVKTMNLMAQERGIELTSQELKQVEKTGDIYYESLNNAEITAMGIDRNTIYSLYKEYMIAQKVYQDIIKDINPEVSDDEARNITIEYILIKTYYQDGTGQRKEYTEDEKKNAYSRAEEAHKRALDGEEFENLIGEYSEVQEMTKSVGKDDLESDYVKSALFELSNDEISEILTTDEGYLVAKCLSTYDLDETDANKIKIVEQQKEAVFGEVYDSFVVNLTRKLNDTLWDSITFIHDSDVTTSDFFQVADNNLILDGE